MKTGFDQIGRRWQWRGRRYYAGAIMGLWIGMLLGAILAVALDLKEHWNPLWLVGLLLAQIVVALISRAVEGRPPVEEALKETSQE